MRFFSKARFGFTILLVVLLVSCANSGPRVKVVGTSVKVKQKYPKVLAIQDDDLGDLLISRVKSKQIKEIGLNRAPMFILSGGVGNFRDNYSQTICDSVNNNQLNTKFMCLVYPMNNLEDSIKYLRNQYTSYTNDKRLWADFLITRADYIVDKQYNNSGPLKGLPSISTMFFLDGQYLYLFGQAKYSAIEFTRLVDNYIIAMKKQGKPSVIYIGFSNNLARKLLTKLILQTNKEVSFKLIPANLKNKTQNIDFAIIADAGYKVDKITNNYVNNSNGKYFPITISTKIITKIQESNPEISKTETTRYYETNQLGSILNVLKALDNVSSINKPSSNYVQSKNSKVITSNSKNKPEKIYVPPFFHKKQFDTSYINNKITGKTKFQFKIKPVKKILKLDSIILKVKNIHLYSIGIKNILVSSKLSNQLKSFYLFLSFIDKLGSNRANLPTKDVEYGDYESLINGGLSNNKLIYNYSELNYEDYLGKYYYSNFKLPKDLKKAINNLSSKNYPKVFGPMMPTDHQAGIISDQYKKTLMVNNQKKELRKITDIIDQIKKEKQLNK